MSLTAAIDGCLAGTGDPALPPNLLSTAECEKLTG
jgi:hypothetical protein